MISVATMSISALIDAIDLRMKEISEEISALQRERQAFENEASELEKTRQLNRRDLVGYLLPDLDDEDLRALEKRLKYPSLLEIKRIFESKLAEVDALRQNVEQDPRFVEREVRLVDIETQLAEVKEAFDAFKREREPWEESAEFQDLLARGYFQEGYESGFFGWVRDWRAVSLLMAHLEQRTGLSFPDDDDVRARWQKHSEASEPVFAHVRRLEEERAQIQKLIDEHEALTNTPAVLHQELWNSLAKALNLHFDHCPEDVLLGLARDDESLQTFLKKDAGIRAQRTYLQEVSKTRVGAAISALEADLQKLRMKRAKLVSKRARGKFVSTEADLARLKTSPVDKWQRRRESFGRTRDRITTFHHYDHGAFVSNYLWWDLMMKHDPGHDLHTVGQFRATHPNWSVSNFSDPLHMTAHDASTALDFAAHDAVDRMLESRDATAFDPS